MVYDFAIDPASLYAMFFRFLSVVIISSAVLGYGQTTRKRPIESPRIQKSAIRAAVDDKLSQHLSAAQTYQLAGDLDSAAVENKAIIAIALQRIGIAELERRKYTDASASLLTSIAMRDSSLSRAGLAAAYLQLGRRDEALTEAQTAVLHDPKNSRARQILGSIYYSAGNYESALPELEQVFRLSPDFDSAYLLGITYLRLKQLDRAKLLFDEIQLTVKTRRADVHILFGQAFEQTGYIAEAEKEFEAAIALEPRVAKAHFYLGFVILQHGGSDRLPEARKEFEAELKLTPQDFHANFFAGVTNSSLNNHKQALLYLRRATHVNPKSSEAHLFLAQSQLDLNDLVGAEKSLRLSLQLSDKTDKHLYQDRRAHFLLGRLLMRTGRKAEGEDELAKARVIQDQLLASDRQEIGKILGQVTDTESGDVKAKQIGIGAENPSVGNQRTTAPVRDAEFVRVRNHLAGIVAEAYHNLGVIFTQKGDLHSGIDNFEAALRQPQNGSRICPVSIGTGGSSDFVRGSSIWLRRRCRATLKRIQRTTSFEKCSGRSTISQRISN
jgi:tetratricopeptide (TPR) repeat protein